MFRWVVASSLKLRYIVLALAMVMVAFGVTRLREMPVDVFPEFAPPPCGDSDRRARNGYR